MAWKSLLPEHRRLLESIGASQWKVVDESLGVSADSFLRSAGHRTLVRSARIRLDRAVAVWVSELRIVLINIDHPTLESLDEPAHEEFVARSAWHEWGHALSLERCSPEDVAAGSRLLALAPDDTDCAPRSPARSAAASDEQIADALLAVLECLDAVRTKRIELPCVRGACLRILWRRLPAWAVRERPAARLLQFQVVGGFGFRASGRSRHDPYAHRQPAAVA